MASTPLSALRSTLAAIRDPPVPGPASVGGGTGYHGSLSSSSAAAGAPPPSAGALADVAAAQQAHELARQLALQTDYNNELLAQLHRLEEDNLGMQRAASDKQAALRQALAVADAARADANDAKRRLAVAQEVCVKLSEEVKEARGEAGAVTRQAEALERWAADARAEIARLQAEKAAAEAQVRRRRRLLLELDGRGLWRR
jgi:hypothetical protein